MEDQNKSTKMLRERYFEKGSSYRKLAEKLGIGFKSLQRYVTGQKRIPLELIEPINELLFTRVLEKREFRNACEDDFDSGVYDTEDRRERKKVLTKVKQDYFVQIGEEGVMEFKFNQSGSKTAFFLELSATVYKKNGRNKVEVFSISPKRGFIFNKKLIKEDIDDFSAYFVFCRDLPSKNALFDLIMAKLNEEGTLSHLEEKDRNVRFVVQDELNLLSEYFQDGIDFLKKKKPTRDEKNDLLFNYEMALSLLKRKPLTWNDVQNLKERLLKKIDEVSTKIP